MAKLNAMTVAERLGLLIGSGMLGIVLLVAVFLVTERRLIADERQHKVRQTVEVAHGLVSRFHDLVGKGIKPLGQMSNNVSRIGGSSILGSGEVAQSLDVSALMRQTLQQVLAKRPLPIAA